MVANPTKGFDTNPNITHQYCTHSQKREKPTRTETIQHIDMGKNRSRKMNGSKITQVKLPTIPRN